MSLYWAAHFFTTCKKYLPLISFYFAITTSYPKTKYYVILPTHWADITTGLKSRLGHHEICTMPWLACAFDCKWKVESLNVENATYLRYAHRWNSWRAYLLYDALTMNSADAHAKWVELTRFVQSACIICTQDYIKRIVLSLKDVLSINWFWNFHISCICMWMKFLGSLYHISTTH